jgi:aminodeoxyfutalosine deaminase
VGSDPTTLYRAAWLLPIVRPPIRDGWLVARAGRIVAVGGRGDPIPAGEAEPVDLGRAALLPGLVNAHTHLELSALRGQVPPAARMSDWVRTLLLRRSVERDEAASVRGALAEARASGTVLVGDISNTLVSLDPLVASGLRAVVFRELIGFRPDGVLRETGAMRAVLDRASPSARVRLCLAAHAPYSVAPALFEAIADARPPGAPLSMHLAESAEEIELLASGGGPFRALLEDFGVWDPAWAAPACRPVEYLDRFGLIDESTLVVHGVHLQAKELRRLAAVGATLVTCPRSNAWTGAGAPPVGRFYASGVRVAVGTDSLASAPDLNVFAELAVLRRLAPEVPAARLLDSATRQGARALGFGAELGTLEPGRTAEVLAVALPAAVKDVEEYLVGGLEPAQLRWPVAFC